MLVQMREIAERVKACLSYGMLVTKVFEAFSIPLKG